MTPEVISRALRQSGALSVGMVVACSVIVAFDTPPSHHRLLALEYSSDAPSSAPERVRLKLPKPHKLDRALRELRELRFYTDIAPQMPEVPVPRCYGAGLDPGLPFLLLEDCSDTHAALTAADWPTQAQLEAMVDALADLHARWWADPALLDVAGGDPLAELLPDLERNQLRYERLVAAIGGELTAEQHGLFRAYIERAPDLLGGRLRNGGPLTLCHPDNHHGNFLFPHDPAGRTLIIDWHGYAASWGPSDIAGLLLRCLPADERDRADQLLQRYHERLLSLGVRGYGWQTCLDDYRLGVLEFLGPLVSAGGAYERWFWRYWPVFLAEWERVEGAALLGV